MSGIFLRVIAIFFASIFARLTYAGKPVIASKLRPSIVSAANTNWWRDKTSTYFHNFLFFDTSYVSASQLTSDSKYNSDADIIVQHRTNRFKYVLCVEDICASNSSLLLVSGEVISMGEYCLLHDFRCVTTKTSVNNLKAVANEVGKTRWKNVYLTAYDVRMPFWYIWVVQGVEDFFQLFLETISLPGLTAGAAVAAVDAENEVYFMGHRDV